MLIYPETSRYRILAGRNKGEICSLMNDCMRSGEYIDVMIHHARGYNVIANVKKADLETVCEIPGGEADDMCKPYSLRSYKEHHAYDCTYMLRAQTYAQPRALVGGDVLAGGDMVLEAPRRGYRDSAILNLKLNGWVEVMPSLPIALKGRRKFKYPGELLKGDKLVVQYAVRQDSTSKNNKWVGVYLNFGNDPVKLPYCIPLALR